MEEQNNGPILLDVNDLAILAKIWVMYSFVCLS